MRQRNAGYYSNGGVSGGRSGRHNQGYVPNNEAGTGAADNAVWTVSAFPPPSYDRLNEMSHPQTGGNVPPPYEAAITKKSGTTKEGSEFIVIYRAEANQMDVMPPPLPVLPPTPLGIANSQTTNTVANSVVIEVPAGENNSSTRENEMTSEVDRRTNIEI